MQPVHGSLRWPAKASHNWAMRTENALNSSLEALLSALGEAGREMPQDAVEAIIAGIAAAPEPLDDAKSLALLTSEPSPGIRAAIRQAVGAVRDGMASVAADHGASAERLARLRGELERLGLDGFLLPMADEYQNEYVPARALRIAWLSGFTGSAGLIIVLAGRAAIFTDGRYTLQVGEQVDTSLFETRHITDQPPAAWLAEALGPGARLGYDPWFLTPDTVARFRRAAEAAGGELVAVEGNPVDAVWPDQPPRPLSPVAAHELRFAGESSADKRARIGAELAKAGADAAVITAVDSIAWLLNIRGRDVARTPLPLSFAILSADGQADLFIDRRKLGAGLEAHLGNEVRVRAEEDFGDGLAELAGRTVHVDPAVSAAWVFERLEAAAATIARGPDPCQLPKARKNERELDGTRNAHRRDGAALCRFLNWLAGAGQSGGVDEIAALEQLAGYRRAGEHFQDLSFDTISGAGANGAIVHYRVTPESNAKLEPGSLYLVDSGAQYLDGTTDVTRTIAIGEPTDEIVGCRNFCNQSQRGEGRGAGSGRRSRHRLHGQRLVDRRRQRRDRQTGCRHRTGSGRRRFLCRPDRRDGERRRHRQLRIDHRPCRQHLDSDANDQRPVHPRLYDLSRA